MGKWMIVKLNYDGIVVAGIIQETDYDPDYYEDVLPGLRFDDDDAANAACAELAQRENIPVYGDIVASPFACPQCGNREMDSLIMDDQDMCTCQNCGTVYDPLKTEKPAH
jgi:rubredoxin